MDTERENVCQKKGDVNGILLGITTSLRCAVCKKRWKDEVWHKYPTNVIE
jgi:hypothetical protein